MVDLTKPGSMKPIGCAKNDAWNSHFLGKLVAALPNGMSRDTNGEIILAVVAGQVDIKPSDPVEAMLSGQMIAANEAALDMYRRAWINDQSFDVRTKYLALADKGRAHCCHPGRGSRSAPEPWPAADHGQTRHRQRRPGDRGRPGHDVPQKPGRG